MNIKKVSVISIFAAMTTVLTLIYKMPLPNQLGYVHFGDSIIYLAAFLFGGNVAALSGAIGGALADLFSGYAIYVVPTAIIKGLMGYIAGTLYIKCNGKYLKMIISFLIAGLIMVFGYYATEVIMTKSFITPLGSVPFNFLQACVSIPIPCILLPLLKNKIRL